MKRKYVVFSISIIMLIIVLCASSLSASNYHKQLANSFGLPTNIVTIKKSIFEYSPLYANTNISRIHWGISKPINKIKEYNPYNDYYIIDESQSVIADIYTCISASDNKIFVDDIEKIPNDFHSDKISKVSFYNEECRKDIIVDLSEEEILLLEELVFNENLEPLDVNDFLLDNKNQWKLYEIRFHINGLEGLYYSGGQLIKSFNDNYYISRGYSYAYAEIPKELGKKIDIAFQNANIEF